MCPQDFPTPRGETPEMASCGPAPFYPAWQHPSPHPGAPKELAFPGVSHSFPQAPMSTRQACASFSSTVSSWISFRAPLDVRSFPRRRRQAPLATLPGPRLWEPPPPPTHLSPLCLCPQALPSRVCPRLKSLSRSATSMSIRVRMPADSCWRESSSSKLS